MAGSARPARSDHEFMPSQAMDLRVDPNDWHQNIRGGVKYYRQLLDRYGGDYEKADAAYNWGAGNLDKDIARHGDKWHPLPAGGDAPVCFAARWWWAAGYAQHADAGDRRKSEGWRSAHGAAIRRPARNADLGHHQRQRVRRAAAGRTDAGIGAAGAVPDSRKLATCHWSSSRMIKTIRSQQHAA